MTIKSQRNSGLQSLNLLIEEKLILSSSGFLIPSGFILQDILLPISNCPSSCKIFFLFNAGLLIILFEVSVILFNFSITKLRISIFSGIDLSQNQKNKVGQLICERNILLEEKFGDGKI